MMLILLKLTGSYNSRIAPMRFDSEYKPPNGYACNQSDLKAIE
jgi:hypothetical protein